MPFYVLNLSHSGEIPDCPKWIVCNMKQLGAELLPTRLYRNTSLLSNQLIRFGTTFKNPVKFKQKVRWPYLIPSIAEFISDSVISFERIYGT